MKEGYKIILASVMAIILLSSITMVSKIFYGFELKRECNEYNKEYNAYFEGHLYDAYDCYIKMTDGSKVSLDDFKELDRIRKLDRIRNIQTKEPIRR